MVSYATRISYDITLDLILFPSVFAYCHYILLFLHLYTIPILPNTLDDARSAFGPHSEPRRRLGSSSNSSLAKHRLLEGLFREPCHGPESSLSRSGC